ncbi:MAG: alpha/beta hydrolase [Pseudomonadota bacterium]
MIPVAAPFESKIVTLRDGQPCHLLDGGCGPTILFIHGLPGVGGDFLPLAEQLVGDYRCILLDRPGYGLSTPLVDGRRMGVAESARDIAELIDELSLSELCVVGWSYGGHIAAALSVSARSAIDRIVFLGSTGPDLRWPTDFNGRLLFGTRLGSRLLRMTRRFLPGLLRKELDRAVGHRVTDQFYDDFFNGLDQPGALENWLAEGRHWNPADMRAEAVSHPSLVLHGEQDARVPVRVGRALAQRLPDARLRILADAGHWPFVTHREEIAAALFDFLRAEPVSTDAGTVAVPAAN